ncbi:hypothetical protein FIV38_03560 [Pseudomonas proteolytica]|nr:hypothetical protein F4W61_00205 [Pseudomonas proteolytica]QHG26099.1 hypothetical protein GDV60_25840 [Pseudomonas sp. DTU12.1]TWR85599.1 hypothetical protein FIV38_03560 [Pseudomonas proteolytica]
MISSCSRPWCSSSRTPGPDTPHSRASPLPHLTAFQRWNSVKCGSGLAREYRRLGLQPYTGKRRLIARLAQRRHRPGQR